MRGEVIGMVAVEVAVEAVEATVECEGVVDAGAVVDGIGTRAPFDLLSRMIVLLYKRMYSCISAL